MKSIWSVGFQGRGWKEFPQKCVTCDTPNSGIDGLICKLVEEIIAHQAVLDLSATPIEVFLQQLCLKVVIHKIQADSFNKFNGYPAFILLQYENISATNGCVVETLCMAEWEL